MVTGMLDIKRPLYQIVRLPKTGLYKILAKFYTLVNYAKRLKDCRLVD